MILINRINFIPVVVLVFVHVLISCNINSSKEKRVPQPDIDLNGELYIVAPSIDTIRCLAYGECDCCASHYLFINDIEFIAVAYCLESDTYFKGTYNLKSNKILFSADGRFVDKEYPMDDEIELNNNDTVTFKLKSNQGKPIKIKWIRFDCKNTVSFITDEFEPQFATMDTEEDFEELLKEIKQEGIWTSLGME